MTALLAGLWRRNMIELRRYWFDTFFQFAGVFLLFTLIFWGAKGIGGADIRKGSGLIGLKDRVEMLGGHMQIESHPGNGTSLHVTIPVEGTDG